MRPSLHPLAFRVRYASHRLIRFAGPDRSYWSDWVWRRHSEILEISYRVLS